MCDDGIRDSIPRHKVELTGLSLRCSRCGGSLAHWCVDEQSMCHLCLLDLSGIDADYERDLFDALISPELVSVSASEVLIRVFQTTCLAPICKLINELTRKHAAVTLDTELHFQYWFVRPRTGTKMLSLEGEGWYHIESQTFTCHAPLIKLTRAPIGRMAGFMKILNDHSMRVRSCVPRVVQRAANL